jgi:hypothetical protein
VFLDLLQILPHVHFLDVRRVVLDFDQLFDKFPVLQLDLHVIPDTRQGFFAFDFLFLLSIQRFASLNFQELLIEVLLRELVLKGEFIVHFGK